MFFDQTFKFLAGALNQYIPGSASQIIAQFPHGMPAHPAQNQYRNQGDT
jgi:hypothetical protein